MPESEWQPLPTRPTGTDMHAYLTQAGVQGTDITAVLRPVFIDMAERLTALEKLTRDLRDHKADA